LLRLALGILQVLGATLAMVLLLSVGVTRVSITVVVIMGLFTTLSVLLFGSRYALGHAERVATTVSKRLAGQSVRAA
jgi:hypothetical protein